MRTFSWTARSAVVSVVLLSSLTACGGGTPDSGASPRKAPTTAASSPTGENQVVRLPSYGISFEIPDGWTKISADGVLSAESPMVTDFASKLGRSPAEVLTMLKTSIKMMAVSDAGMDRGFLENINAVDAQQSSITAEQLKLQLLGIGAKITSTGEGDSALGTVYRVSYSLPTNGTSHGCALAVDIGDTVVVVTASARGAAAAEARIDQVQATLAEL